MSDLRSHLQSIYDRLGRLTPDDVLDEARNPEHPLHHRFTWDDSLAAEQYRRGQAQKLITEVRVQYVDREGVKRAQRAFIAVRQPVPTPRDDAAPELLDDETEPYLNNGFRYLPVEVVTRDESLARQALAQMEHEWRSLKRRYETFSEFWSLVRADVAAKN